MSMSGRSALFRWIDAASGFQRVVEGLASQGLSPTQSGAPQGVHGAQGRDAEGGGY